MRYQFFAGKLIRRWLMAISAFTLIVMSLAVLEVEASDGIPFTPDDAGKFVDMGGRKWVVLDVVDGKPYLMMDSVYANRAWNSDGNSADASEIFQYLQDEFNNIITVTEHRDLIADTAWQIFSMKFGDFEEHSSAGGKPIDPASITQPLGLISYRDSNYCDHFNPVLSKPIWTRTPVNDTAPAVYTLEPAGPACLGVDSVPNHSAIGVQPALYLKESVRIRGGSGTAADPYVLSLSAAPVAANITADGTTDTVTVKSVPADTTVNVYASADQTTPIGSKKNGNSEGAVTVSVSKDLRWNEKVFVTFTQPSMAESNKVEATVQDNDPPIIDLTAPSTPTNHKVIVTATITDPASDIAEKKWEMGARDIAHFHNYGQILTGNTFEVQENGTYTVYAVDQAGNEAVKQISITSMDRTPPSIFDVSIRSSHALAGWARVNDQITLEFEASEELAPPIVTIAENAAMVTNHGGLKYEATYTMQATDPAGPVTFSIDYRDLAGNVGDTVTETSDDSQVQFDPTGPVITFSPNGDADPARTAASTVTVTDGHSGVDAETLQYVWTNSEDEPVSGWQSFSNGAQLKLDDPLANGNWYLHVRANDMVGNASYVVSAAFVLDNSGPAITFSSNGETGPAKTATSTVTVADVAGVDTLEYVWADSAGEPTDGWQPFSSGAQLQLDDPSANGNWYLHVRSHDNLGNFSYAVSDAFILDNEAPVITLQGDNPLTIEAGSPFTDPGATATDNIDGDLTSSIVVTGTVDSTTAGTYVLTYDVTDAAGNKAVTVTRTVIVQSKHVPSPPTADSGGSDVRTGVRVVVNGKLVPAGEFRTVEVDGQTITTVVVDEQLLQQRLEAGKTGETITIFVAADSDVVIFELSGQLVKSMELKQAVLEVHTGLGTYVLPIEQINIDTLSKRFGEDIELSDIKFHVTIATPPASTIEVVEAAARRGHFTLVQPPVAFRVTVTYNGHSEDVSSFNSFVMRTIPVPEQTDPNRITTAVVVEPDGTTRHVPTKIIEVDGQYYSAINSLSNSTYAVIWNDVEFSDVENHWAKQSINNMGSRLVVNGTGDDKYSPDRNVTRAEFAAIITRALGLRQEAGPSLFTDVSSGDWFAGAVNTASSYGLLRGFEDGSFKPHELITREQAMVIVAQAMKLTGLADTLPEHEPGTVLQAFEDAGEVALWAVQGVADNVQANMINGRSNSELAPKAFMTRAEVAVIVERLLLLSGLI